MTTSVDQKAYLQKYLGGPSKEKKKKKKKVIKGKGFKIIDDDIDLSKLRPLESDELDILGEGEDAPQIAGIVDDRPEELKKLDQFKTSSKWRVINQDDGFNSNLEIEEIKKDIKETEKENEIIFGKMYSDSEDEQQKNDSDVSPPRKKSSKKHTNDSDFSPPRKSNQSQQKKDESDASPMKHEARKERARKPSRWADADPESNTRNEPKFNRSDSDISPPRKRNNYDSDDSPPRKKKLSPRNRDRYRQIKSPSSDLSPPRKNDRRKSQSPVRRSNKSPERHLNREYSRTDKGRREMTDRNRMTLDNDRRDKVNTDAKSNRRQNGSDVSPTRRDRDRNGTDRSRNTRDRNMPSPKYKRKNSSDSDLSPPRKGSDKRQPRASPSPQNSKRKHDSDSDLSPPRKDRNKQRRNSNSPPPTNKKMAKTLEGKKAGLQDARQLREENEEFRKKEDEVFKKLADNVSGRNAKVVSRKSKRDTSEDREKQKEKAERQKELDAKYKMWSKGLKQMEAQEARIQDFIHEASKPVARHKGDKDLEHSLKQVERAGDPMLQYMRERKRERGELPPEKPSYKGSFPPNRFNIRPGYRWDGVDRSNGYENKYFQQQSKKKAQEEEAYKWSTEDL